MTAVTKEFILAASREHVGTAPSPERAEELAIALNTLLGAAERQTPDLPYEAEPAHFFKALDDLAQG